VTGMERIPERRKREAVASVKTTVHDIYGGAQGRKKAAGGGGSGGRNKPQNSLAARKGRAALAVRPPFSTRPGDGDDKENNAALESQPQRSSPTPLGGDVSLAMVGERLKGKGTRAPPKSAAVVF
jgi:hypothetical protein